MNELLCRNMAKPKQTEFSLDLENLENDKNVKCSEKTEDWIYFSSFCCYKLLSAILCSFLFQNLFWQPFFISS